MIELYKRHLAPDTHSVTLSTLIYCVTQWGARESSTRVAAFCRFVRLSGARARYHLFLCTPRLGHGNGHSSALYSSHEPNKCLIGRKVPKRSVLASRLTKSRLPILYPWPRVSVRPPIVLRHGIVTSYTWRECSQYGRNVLLG